MKSKKSKVVELTKLEVENQIVSTTCQDNLARQALVFEIRRMLDRESFDGKGLECELRRLFWMLD